MSSETRLPIAKPTASALSAFRVKRNTWRRQKIGETRRAAVEHASGFAPPHAARLSAIRHGIEQCAGLQRGAPERSARAPYRAVI
jgi:hypothetical protein